MRGESEGGEREKAATVVRENRRKGEGGGEGRVEGETGWCSVCEHYQMSWWSK